MRFSIAIAVSCAVSSIAQPIIAGENAAVAIEGETTSDAVQGKWNNFKWTGKDGKECSGKWLKDGFRIRMTQQKKRHQTCIDGALEHKDTPFMVRDAMAATIAHDKKEKHEDDVLAVVEKRDELDVQEEQDVQDDQVDQDVQHDQAIQEGQNGGKMVEGKRYYWRGPPGQTRLMCSAVLEKDDVIHFRRASGEPLNPEQAQLIVYCIKTLRDSPAVSERVYHRTAYYYHDEIKQRMNDGWEPYFHIAQHKKDDAKRD